MEFLKNLRTPHIVAANLVLALGIISVIGYGLRGTGPSRLTAAHPTPAEVTVSGYLPTWLSDKEYARISRLHGLDQLYVAFATVDAAGNIADPTLTPAGIAAIKALGSKAHKGVYLSVGGHGDGDVSHRAILAGFAAGLKSPQVFAARIQAAVQNLESTTGQTGIGVDIDMEYPTAAQAGQLPALVSALHAAGITNVSMAVAANGSDAKGIQQVATKLSELGVTFNVMTYDLNGPWSRTAGPITSRPIVTASISDWSAASHKPDSLSVGIPTYCYEFVGARKAGDSFNKSATAALAAAQPVQFTSLNPVTLQEDTKTGTLSGTTANGWVSCVGPQQAVGTIQAVLADNKVGGAFLWDLRGASDGYISKLERIAL